LRKKKPQSIASQQIDVLLPSLKRYALHLIRDIAAADDLVQETFVRGIANIRRWHPGTELRAWLLAILHNQFVTGIRRASREGTKIELA
jgi:RNA polymerase sigma-70 factor (ECF subfamily)